MTLLPTDFALQPGRHGTHDPVEIEIVYCDPEGQPERRRRMPLAACLGAVSDMPGIARTTPPERMRARPGPV